VPQPLQILRNGTLCALEHFSLEEIQWNGTSALLRSSTPMNQRNNPEDSNSDFGMSI
jgi:hypothetical protein